MNTPKVAIIVLTWNQRALTMECLDSLAALEYPAHRLLIILVDNASEDGTAVAIRAAFPDVIVLQNRSNLGYAGGNNVGIQLALEYRVDYVCILNNDTVLAPDCLRTLIDEAETHPQIGLVGPKIYYSEPEDMVFAAGSMIDWRKGELVHRGIWQRETQVGPMYSLGPEDVDFAIGCCVLAKRSAIEQIGLLDERYYLNFEDADWCLRARQTGFRVRYTPEALLWHKVSASLGLASPGNTYYMTRNALLFFWSHLGGWRRWRTVGRIVARNLGHIGAWTLGRQSSGRNFRRKRDANLMALRDFFLGRYGRMGSDVARICDGD